MKFGKMIGIGNTASVYEWEEGKVLKLFHKEYPDEAVENEYRNAMLIRDMEFAKPKIYEIISYEGRKGIIYDKIEGESLLDWVMRTQDVQQCASYMATLHKTIAQNTICSVADYKDFLKQFIPQTSLPAEEQDNLLQMIDQLPNGNTLCHGDFHPGNIILSAGDAYIIDFMNICHGDYLYDVARTVLLVEYTPVPPEVEDKEMILSLKKSLTDLYLSYMNVTREMIKDYLTVLIAVRKGECPNE